MLWLLACSCARHHSHLLRPAAAAELASQARETLLRWQVDTAQANTRQLFGMDTECAAFLRWLDLFEQLYQETGGNLRLVVERIRAATDREEAPFDALAHLVDGSVALPPQAPPECAAFLDRGDA